jgi:hypothetical protein
MATEPCHLSSELRHDHLSPFEATAWAAVLLESCKEFWPAEKLANSRLPEKKNDERFRAFFPGENQAKV